MGRIQELYELTGDNRFAIAKGIATSSKSVTLAALLLCVAIAGFLKSKIMLLQQLATGIGLTILLDATICRVFFVPAIMSIFGGKIVWYCPPFIKDALDRIGLKESSE